MTTPQPTLAPEAALRQLVEATAAAIRVKDVTAAAAGYAADVLLFDLIEPLQTRGSAALRARLEQWFASFAGPIGFELRELQITAGAGVAFCHSLNHVRATQLDGQVLEMSWRATLCFEQRAGEWQVVHSHTSVPFNMQTGLASMELEG